MDPEQLRGVVHAAIDNALAGQAAANLQKEREFRQVIAEASRHRCLPHI